MKDLSMSALLEKYKNQTPKRFGDYMERQYPISAVMDIIKELKDSNCSIQFAEWLSDNDWVKRKRTHPNHVGKYWSTIHCEYKTIEELFEMFCKEN